VCRRHEAVVVCAVRRLSECQEESGAADGGRPGDPLTGVVVSAAIGLSIRLA